MRFKRDFIIFVYFSHHLINSNKKETNVCFSIRAKCLWLKIINSTYLIWNTDTFDSPPPFSPCYDEQKKKQSTNKIVYFYWAVILTVNTTFSHQLKNQLSCNKKHMKIAVPLTGVHKIYDSHSSYSIYLEKEKKRICTKNNWVFFVWYQDWF